MVTWGADWGVGSDGDGEARQTRPAAPAARRDDGVVLLAVPLRPALWCAGAALVGAVCGAAVLAAPSVLVTP